MDKDNIIPEEKDVKPVRINGIPVSMLNQPNPDELTTQRVPEEEPTLTDREVMEHTASIWQYNPIRDDGTELHSESHSKYTKADFGEIIAARVRGKKHKHDGSNCDDWFETAEAGGCFIAVAADGAGSKHFSRIGARVCCEGAVAYLKDRLLKLLEENPDLKDNLSLDMAEPMFLLACGQLAPLVQNAAREAFDKVIDQLKQLYNDSTYSQAIGRKPSLSDFSCTYLAAIAIPLTIDGERQCFTVTAQIGDGCICALNSEETADRCLKLLGEADSGAFSGETDFLSEKTVDGNIIAGKTKISRGKSDLIMIMTDGVADDYFPSAPMIKRLYLDLCLNGILPMEGDSTVAEQPEPIRFRSVSMSQRSVELQYAKQLINGEDAAAAIDMLWDKRNALKCHSLEAYGISLGETSEERLLTWLDNYNERGSFDDRTLVIMRLF